MAVALAIGMALTIAGVYAQTISGLVREWTSSPDASYGLVLVAVALAVLWGRRQALIEAVASSTSFSLLSLGALAGALALYLVGQLGADVFLTRVSLVMVAAAALWFTCGTAALRIAAAPILFLLIAVPLPALIVNAVTLPLQLIASQIAEHTLSAAGVAVFRDGNVLQLPSGSLEVAEACSGLRSAVSLAAIAVMLAWTQPTWPRRCGVVLASVPLAIVMNGLRVVGTAVASEAWGPEMATGSWHTFTGWITFVVSVGVLLMLQRAIAGPAPRPAALTPAVSA
jgi:exosortase